MEASTLQKMAAEIASVVSQYVQDASQNIKVDVQLPDAVTDDKSVVSVAMYDENDIRLFAVNVGLLTKDDGTK